MSRFPARLMPEDRSSPRSAEEAQALARGRLYRLVGLAFAFPHDALYEELASGAWERAVVEASAALPFSLGLADLSLTPAQAAGEELKAEYVRLFDVGRTGGPPCPLFAGHHERDRLHVMEELVRFYDFFGLSLAAGTMPDHLTAELEFMHFLTFREGEALRDGGDRQSYLRAERDFLGRHLGRFLTRLATKARAEKPLPFFDDLLELSHRFAQEDHAYVVATLGGA